MTHNADRPLDADELRDLPHEELVAQALAAERENRELRGRLESSEERRQVVVSTSARTLTWAFFGPQLYGALRAAWDGFDQWFANKLEDDWPKAEVRDALAAFVARFTRMGLLAILLGLLPASFLLIQALLLNTQNKRFADQNALFERQNNLLGFQVTANFRQAFFQAPFDDRFRRIDDYVRSLTAEQEGRTEDGAPVIHRWPRPNPSLIDQVAELATDEPETTVGALRPLLKDDAVSVASSAMLVFVALGQKSFTDPLTLARADLTSSDLSEVDFADVDLSEAVLGGSNFSGARITGSLDGIDAPFTGWVQSELVEADFTDAELTAANFRQASLQDVNFARADLRNSEWFEASLNQTDFTGACLLRSRFLEADLAADPAGDDQPRSAFKGADLTDADLRGADLADVKNWAKAVFKGANVWGVIEPPKGMREHLAAEGAVCIASNDWRGTHADFGIPIADCPFTASQKAPIDIECGPGFEAPPTQR